MDYSRLENVGININTLIERLMGNEALIKRFFLKFVDDKQFCMLEEAVKNNNHEEAVAAAHTLKGMCGNLSITVLFELFSKQVELMRSDNWEEAFAMMQKINPTYNKIVITIKQLFQ